MSAGTLPLPKVDWPAEYGAWRDTGCRLHPRCLSCPERACVEDREPLRAALAERNARIRTAYAHGARDAGELARAFGISRRTAWRITQAAR